MRIAGLQPFSLTDFPEKISGIFFTAGCNFACSYCYNKSLLKKDCVLIPERRILDFLKSRTTQLDGIVITGGEPTLQKDLIKFIKTVRSYGYLIKLDTNGARPDVLISLLAKKYLDYIAMDIKAPFEKYSVLIGRQQAPIVKLQESIKIIAYSGIKHEFRTTFVPHFLAKKDLEVIKTYFPKKSPYRVQEYVPV